MEIIKESDKESITRTSNVLDGVIEQRAKIEQDRGELKLDVSELVFHDGNRSKMHTHTFEQLLYVAGGTGEVGTESGSSTVSAGEWIRIPPNEPHYHGAAKGKTFIQLSIILRDVTEDETAEV